MSALSVMTLQDSSKYFNKNTKILTNINLMGTLEEKSRVLTKVIKLHHLVTMNILFKVCTVHTIDIEIFHRIHEECDLLVALEEITKDRFILWSQGTFALTVTFWK